MDLPNRIEKIIAEFEKSKAPKTKFATKVRAPRSLVSNWLSGKAKPGADYRSSICKEYGISREWLDTGKGNMLIDKQEDSQQPPPQTVNRDDLLELQGRYKELKEEVIYYREEIKDVLQDIKCLRKKTKNDNHPIINLA